MDDVCCMKYIINKTASLKICLMCIFAFSGLYLKAQLPNGSTAISTCFQKFAVQPWQSSQNYKLLKTNGNNDLTITDVLGTYDFHYFQAWKYDAVNSDWTTVDFSGPDMVWDWVHLQKPGGGLEYEKVWRSASWNTGYSLNFNSSDKIVLNLFVAVQGAPGGPVSINPVYQNVGIDFVEPNDFMDIGLPEGKTCFTYSQFNFNSIFDVSELTGFCGSFSYKIKLPPNATTTYGLPSNYSADVYPNTAINIPVDFSTIICYPSIDPVPGCCITLNLECTLLPCSDAPANCVAQTFIKPITVCLNCDNRNMPNN